MKIDLAEKLAKHFQRVEDLAQEASEDSEESFSARASAMTAMTAVIKELTKEQEKIFNMGAIQELQSAIVEALEEYSPELKEEVLEVLERRLATLSS
jgi:flagellar biosynthesis chaperone FliJ